MTEAAKDIGPGGAGSSSRRGSQTIAEILGEFVDGFNTNSLDDVMTFFADDAVYEPGDGRTHRGRAAIREAFRPQFDNAYGTMKFIVNDQVIDERARKATIRWVCQHDFATTKSFVQRLLFKAMFGRGAGWYGTDIFHFDERGKIIGKFSYANYGSRPQLRRDLRG
jgi:uncharacterized protein (TIGR02246 family)